MSRIKKLFQKLCSVDPISHNTTKSQKTADAIAALREQLSGGGDTGLSTDGIMINPSDPISPSALANGDGFIPQDTMGIIVSDEFHSEPAVIEDMNDAFEPDPKTQNAIFTLREQIENGDNENKTTN